jgi:hypothetical protein
MPSKSATNQIASRIWSSVNNSRFYCLAAAMLVLGSRVLALGAGLLLGCTGSGETQALESPLSSGNATDAGVLRDASTTVREGGVRENPQETEPEGPPACNDGDTRCQGEQLQTCEAGRYEDTAACVLGCDDGSCVTECEPGERQCQTETTPALCTESGVWEAQTECQEELSCNAKTAQCSCVEGALR